ncbi:hypothetical protein Q4489_12975 [Thalassotalea sp. 1_MG-2023]|uniref:hypothetical protein n=1 Tax=Thalassotalea sp. 1_MG-2023 TaxID=3062680 RepID=UPI0026E3B496|nr:hypothetical protein [Thalassotalea sp. 1_MG-2023]MDO6427934.1 hypothetical protein [Thalassotalea sp. 1_MG-2023]
MKSLNFKEKMVVCICWLITLFMCSSGGYKFTQESLSALELVNIIGVSLIFFGISLAPKMFFTPIKQLFSTTYKLDTLVNDKLQQSIVISGFLISMFALLAEVM